jgi:hypothetical protein
MHDAPHSLRRRTAGLALVALAACAVTAPAAQADSVAYIKGGNVFLSTTDGSRQYQVTSDGGYSTVSQADSGRMVALRGDKLRHLERDGRVIAEIATPVSTTVDPSMAFKGPFDPEISPDGRRVAYTYYWQYTGYDPYCNITNDCSVKRLYHGTGFTDPNRLTAWDEPGFLRRSGWIDASWVDNSTVLLSNPYIQPNEDTVLWSPDDKDSLKRWFEDHAFRGDIEDAAMSRDKSVLATVADNRTKLFLSSTVGGFYPDFPERCYMATVDAGDRISSPTLSADGSRAFWATASKGILTVALPRLGVKTCPPLADEDRVLVAGASNPSWGPADVPPARTLPQPPTPGPGPGTEQPGGGKTPPTPGTTVKLTIGKAKLAAALKKGLTLKLTGAPAGKHKLAAKHGKTTVAKGTVTVKNGTGKATLRFTAAGKRKLKGRKTAALTITAVGASAKVTLRR